MNHVNGRICLLFAVGVIASLGLPERAFAQAGQGLIGNSLGVPTGPVVATAKEKGPKDPLPPALPGTHATKDEAAPAGKGVGDMPPTEALFDAINRGDTPAARDAVNRGADLGTRNILGMTATELSVDLARNDITFLLLSMRGSGDASTGAGVRARAVAQAPDPKSSDPKSSGVKPVRAAVAASSPRPSRIPPSTPTDAARQYATGPNNPGTANPQAGFLGFGITR